MIRPMNAQKNGKIYSEKPGLRDPWFIKLAQDKKIAWSPSLTLFVATCSNWPLCGANPGKTAEVEVADSRRPFACMD